MSDDRWQRLRDLFAEAQELPPEERGAFLDRELRGEPELHAELAALLEAETGAFLAASAGPPAHGSIGPYTLLEILGEGGFGVVYLAEQTDPIRRRVALKLIKPGMDTKQVLARFGAERRALALMDHPGIAQVFEAGATESGHPYFAMEYVPGVPITTFCDQERLRIRDRLELFASVCDAVQHAHQKGVIHRDIKPSNVLVARRDGLLVSKVIDFGIVKATTESIPGGKLTQEGIIVGTLGYMSPEQTGGTDAAVDTRSDIYSLGVVMYELLAGAPPFDAERLRRTALSDAVRVIREEDPPAMSDRVASAERSEEQAAELRSTDTRHLLRELRGELQWIAQRALEKDPERRYVSAADLAADIRRHLAHEPVLAGAPSTMYRLRKYARRHRAGVTAAAFVLAAIVAGGVATGIGFRRAIHAEQAARREAESSRQVADFLVELFRASTPDKAKGETVTARTLLDDGTRRIESGLTGDPHVRARLLDAMGSSYSSLGIFDEGVRLRRDALAASESAQPTDEIEIAQRLCGLAESLSMAGEKDSVLVLVDRAVAILEKSERKDTKLLARCISRKSSWWHEKGELAPAESLITLAIQMAEAEPEPDKPHLLRMYSTRANIAHRQFHLDDAESSYLRALELAKETDQPSSSVGIFRRLASVYRALQQPEKALTHAEEGVKIARRIYAPDHPSLADALGGQADALSSQSRYAEAIAVREEALRILRARGTPEAVSSELNTVGTLYRATGQVELAIASTKESVEIRQKVRGLVDLRTGEALANLGRCYAVAGMTQHADSSFRAAIDVFEQLDDKSIFRPVAWKDYADLCRTAGRPARADSLYTRAEAALDSTNAGMRPYLGECLTGHARVRLHQGRHAEAEQMLQAALPMRGDPAGYNIQLGEVYLVWAAVCADAGDADRAIEKLELADRCGVTPEETDPFPKLVALRSRPDYPLGRSPG